MFFENLIQNVPCILQIIKDLSNKCKIYLLTFFIILYSDQQMHNANVVLVQYTDLKTAFEM